MLVSSPPADEAFAGTARARRLPGRRYRHSVALCVLGRRLFVTDVGSLTEAPYLFTFEVIMLKMYHSTLYQISGSYL